MLSRVAESIYWMNRNVERAENYARFMDVNFNLSLDLPPEERQQWKPLVLDTGDWTMCESVYGAVDQGKITFFLTFDEKNPNSIYSCLINARENARAVRPEITREVWEQMNFLYYLVKNGLKKKLYQKKDPRDFFLQVKKGCQLLYGIFDATISRNEGWHFGNIGSLLERADKTSRVLDVKYHMLLPSLQSIGSPLDLIQWAALLKSVSAYDMYRKTYGKLTPSLISQFLILDKVFPRAIMRCLWQAEESLHTISGSGEGFSNTPEKLLGKLKSQLEFAEIDDIFSTGLHEYLDNIQIQLNDVSTAISEVFFSTENVMNYNNI